MDMDAEVVSYRFLGHGLHVHRLDDSKTLFGSLACSLMKWFSFDGISFAEVHDSLGMPGSS